MMRRLPARLSHLLPTLVAALAGLALAALAPATLAGPVLDRIQAAGTLKVCIWPDYYGITWRNPRTQQLSGIDIELSAELARDMKLKLEYVESSFPKLIDDLKHRPLRHRHACRGRAAGPREKLKFSQPYLQSASTAYHPQPPHQDLRGHRPARRAGGGAGRHLHGAGDAAR